MKKVKRNGRKFSESESEQAFNMKKLRFFSLKNQGVGCLAVLICFSETTISK
jgi:hypothetical protein